VAQKQSSMSKWKSRNQNPTLYKQNLLMKNQYNDIR